MNKKLAPLLVLLLFVPFVFFPQSESRFRIDSVEYDITGTTREYPLKQEVDIDKQRIFSGLDEFERYLSDLRLQFNNIRVLEESSVEPVYGTPDTEGITPVTLNIKTVDTVNIIALPKPGFDSNSGFEMKIKLKNYNFFGSMREFDSDLNYEYDENDNQSVSGGFSFDIPFEALGYSYVWDISSTLTVPFGDPVIYDFSTGIEMEIPVYHLDLHVGFEQSISVNDRDSDKVYYEEDWLYFTEKLYANIPVTLYRYGTTGEIVWTPQVTFTVNWDSDGIQADDLKGPGITVGHSLSAGRINWVGNFRQGYKASLGNTYSFNFHEDKDKEIKVTASIQGHYSFFDRVGVSSRVSWYYNFDDVVSEKQGDNLRGILDKRINTDTALFYNLDIPVRVLRVNFKDLSGIDWTEYISFEMHISPFFDMALTHDLENNTHFSFEDGWYAGGLEIIVYPLKMRSIYARASVGFDLAEVLKNGELSGRADRDGESIRELFIGIGLAY